MGLPLWKKKKNMAEPKRVSKTTGKQKSKSLDRVKQENLSISNGRETVYAQPSVPFFSMSEGLDKPENTIREKGLRKGEKKRGKGGTRR